MGQVGTSKFYLRAAVERFNARIAERKTAEGENPPWIKHVAMLTGVLAAMAGFLTVRSTVLTNDAIYMSNRAILAQTQSSDAWAEYQADSIKAHVAETALLSMPASVGRDALSKQDEDLRARQPGLQKAAMSKSAERDGYLKNSGKALAERDLLSYAGFSAQTAIALASVAVLVRSRNTFYLGIAAGATAVLVMAFAFAIHVGLAPR
jgi:hypothetical protein